MNSFAHIILISAVVLFEPFRVRAENEAPWSLKPITRPKVPAVSDKHWSKNPIDAFVFEKLKSAKLSPSPEAPKRVLIRRVYFDLIGLPPTPEEVQAFEKDRRPDAYERLVDKLLASPRYGERWAQHWLDVVRYSESHGFEMNQPRPNAWRYRDYIIQAFNEDKPYDRFILEQFAGDVFGEDAATGFLVAGPWDQVKSPDSVLTAAQRADELHDMVSVTGSAFLGMTVGCARCHNHKFDPIPQVDYYAIKACLAGVQHGERKLHTADTDARELETKNVQAQLVGIDERLAELEPLASTGRILTFEPEPAFGSRTIRLLKPVLQVNYPEGTSRGERDYAGDVDHLPTSSRNFLCWSNAAHADVFVCEPGVTGPFGLRLSWGVQPWNSTNAMFLLDQDGDLATTNDQILIAMVNERRFSDGAAAEKPKVWSGYLDAGVWNLTASNKIILRGGTDPSPITAGNIGLSEETAPAFSKRNLEASSPLPLSSKGGEGDASRSQAGTLNSTTVGWGEGSSHFLRAPVSARRNVDRFSPTMARFLRFTINRTTDAEPCIDELEVYDEHGTNVALATLGTKCAASSVFPNSDIHRLEHLNEGKYGNSHSWISNERGKGWVQLEFAREISIARVVWGRDREQKYSDRLAVDYKIEAGLTTNDWKLLASSRDRVPYSGGRTSVVDVSVVSPSDPNGRATRELLAQRAKLESRVKELADVPMVYAGIMTNQPEPVNRLQRGDPMQKRELIEPGALSAIGLSFKYPNPARTRAAASKVHSNFIQVSTRIEHPVSKIEALDSGIELSEDQKRRLALAMWIASPSNPLPARVMVNRLWQHHFGEGLVSTPSDFGNKGANPTHPELLDWLAAEFHSGSGRDDFHVVPVSPSHGREWSLKHIQRLIVTSAAYRQASASRPDGRAIDAGARLLWRFPPQRLEAEQLRDAILAISGKLDPRSGGPGFSAFEPNDNYVRVYDAKQNFGPAEWRRMIYMTKVRMQQDSTFGAFDCPDGGQVAPKRMRSTTPLQALNLLNGKFLLQQAGFFAERVQKEASTKLDAQIRRAFELAYGRAPDAQELKTATGFVTHNDLTLLCRVLFNSNEFIFVE